MIHPEELKMLALDRKREFREVFSRIKRKKPKDLDSVVHRLHAEVFSHTDCLSCGNCCKSISPFLSDTDIQRLASHLKMKPSAFAEKYLLVDEDHDYVFRHTPCPFLGNDNYCAVYDYRPKACREYPHTDRKRFIQILSLSLKNTEICPAVFEIAEILRERY